MPSKDKLDMVANALRSRGAEGIILGCTELSIAKACISKTSDLIDSLEVLALSAIKHCGKEPIGFSDELMNFYPERMIYNAVN